MEFLKRQSTHLTTTPPPTTKEPVLEKEAIAVEEAEHLTRDQLGKKFGKTREAVRQWEETGKLAEKGWELVPGTGTNPKNPRLYRPLSCK